MNLDIISYTREGNICDSTEFITIEAVDNTDVQLATQYQLIQDGTIYGTYYVDTYEKKWDGSITVHAANAQKNLLDTYVHETYSIAEYPEYKTRYWIEKFFTDYSIPYTITGIGDGEYLPEDDVLGNEALYSIIDKLLQYTGWYLKYSPTGVATIGDLDATQAPTTILNDTQIKEITTSIDTTPLRNRVVVWGKGNPTTGNYVFADVSVNTPWNMDINDKRTTLISNYHIPNNRSAVNLAAKALKEFAKPRYVKNITYIASQPTYSVLGTTCLVQSDYFSGTGVVTNFSETKSESGFLITLTLDKLCPRLVGVYTFNGYVYIGTQEDGVWRKKIEGEPQTWENFSTGITDLSIKDLQIANGAFATVTNNGHMYYRMVGDTSWTRYYPYLTTVEDGTYHYWPSASGIASACTVDPLNGDIYASFNLANTVSGYGETQGIYGGVYYTTSAGRSWVSSVKANGYSTMRNVSVSGYNNIAVLDIDTNGKNIYLTSIIPGSGVAENLGTIHHKPYDSNDKQLFNSCTNIIASGVLSQREYAVYNDTTGDFRLKMNGPAFYGTYVYGKDINYINSNYEYILKRVDYVTDRNVYITMPENIRDTFVVLDGDRLVAVYDDYTNDQIKVYEVNFLTETYTQTATISYPVYSGLTIDDTSFDGIIGITHKDDEINIVLCFSFYDYASGDLHMHAACKIYYAKTQLASNTTILFPYSYGADDYSIPTLNAYHDTYADLGDHTLIVIARNRNPGAGIDNHVIAIYTDIQTCDHTTLPEVINTPSQTGDYYYYLYYSWFAMAADYNLKYAYMACDRYEYSSALGYFVSKACVIKIDRTSDFTIVYNAGRGYRDQASYQGCMCSKNKVAFSYFWSSLDQSIKYYTFYNLTDDTEIATVTYNGKGTYRISSQMDDVDDAIIYMDATDTTNQYRNIKRMDFQTGSITTVATLESVINASSNTKLRLNGETFMLFRTVPRASTNNDHTIILYDPNLIPGPLGEASGGTSLLEYKNGTFSQVIDYAGDDWHLDMSQDFPTILYGGDNILYNTGRITFYKNLPASGITPYLGYYLTPGNLGGDNYVRDVRTFTTLDEEVGVRRRSAFITDTLYSGDSPHSYLRLLDYDNLSVTEDPYGNEYVLNNEWIMFSGMVKHLETTNMDVNPYYFVSLSGVPSRFFQKPIFDLGDIEPEWVEASSGLPNSEITIIRVDDSL